MLEEEIPSISWRMNCGDEAAETVPHPLRIPTISSSPTGSSCVCFFLTGSDLINLLTRSHSPSTNHETDG
jgi:hypothetical protein